MTSVPDRTRGAAAEAFAGEVKVLMRQGRLDGLPESVVNHWRSKIIQGDTDSQRATEVAIELAEAKDRLRDHMERGGSEDTVSDAEVYDKYAPVFVAPDVTDAVDVVLEMEAMHLRLEIELIGPFLANLPKDEVSSRFIRLKEWLVRTYGYELVITPVLAEFLAQPGDFGARLAELDHLLNETRNGRFRVDNPVQRDLEYRKFSHEYARIYGTNRGLPYVIDPFEALYRNFVDLPELEYEHRDDWRLEGQHLQEVKRVAYEASKFLRFLLRFHEGTSRPIVVVGNNRYGRQWVVEPLEEFLRDGFTLRYHGVPSHMSLRLTVPGARNFEWGANNTGPWTPDAFPMEFVREIDRDMPHIVVADGKSPHLYIGNMMLTRAAKNYAHWIAAFNDVRAEGRRSEYWHESCLPAEHHQELVHWYEFVRLRRQLNEWVTPGPTYNVGLWSPEPTDTVELGELRVPYRPPELDTDVPQFVLANSIIYDTDSLPEELHDTKPYYFDGPERHVKEEIVFGFGPYGFQPAVKGTMTAIFVAAVQRAIRTEVARLMSL
jgi:hypothetical protein